MTRFHRIFLIARLLVLTLVLSACRTVPRPEVIDLGQPGWEVRTGNAIWKSSSGFPEMVTDVLFAKHEQGQVFLQVSKDVLPMVSVHLSGDQWLVESVAGGRVINGKGNLPDEIVWAQLAAALSERPLAPAWQWRPDAVGGTIENPGTGEFARAVFIE